MSTTTPSAVDVVVIGAGLAGLAAARHLVASGLDSQDARQRLLLDNLVRLYGPEARHPLTVQETHWGHEPYVDGCLGFAPPGLLTQCGSALRDPVGPIHWAGAESAHTWINHLSGAVESGIRAATEVIEVLDGSSCTATPKEST